MPEAPAEAVTAPTEVAMASYSDEQADRGQGVFNNACSACHAVSDFRGRTFLYGWRQRTAWDLYLQITETMPEDAPGSLPDQEYVDVVAYILDLNGHRAGDGELSATEASLDQLPVDASEIGSEAPSR